jgi:hypothetical protein
MGPPELSLLPSIRSSTPYIRGCFIMARYKHKHIVTAPRFLPIVLELQLVPDQPHCSRPFSRQDESRQPTTIDRQWRKKRCTINLKPSLQSLHDPDKKVSDNIGAVHISRAISFSRSCAWYWIQMSWLPLFVVHMALRDICCWMRSTDARCCWSRLRFG